MNPVQLIVQALVDIPRWTWRGLVGLVLVVLAYIVPRLAAVSTGLGDILDTGALVGAALLATEVARARAQLPPGATTASDQRGHARAGVLVGLVAIALAIVGALVLAGSAGGCALLERRQARCATPPELVLEDLADGTCAARAFCDGHEVQTAIGPGPCGEVEER